MLNDQLKLSQYEAIFLEKLNTEIKFLKSILAMLNNLNANKAANDTVVSILGHDSWKTNVWHELLEENAIFTADFQRVLNKLEEHLECTSNQTLIVDIFEKLSYLVAKASTNKLSIFHFDFLLNKLEQMGVNIANKTEKLTIFFESKFLTKSGSIGESVYSSKSFKLDDIYLNRIILVDLIENFHATTQAVFLDKLGKNQNS